MQTKAAALLGNKLGGELIAAAKEAHLLGSTVILGDRLYGVTIQRAFDKINTFVDGASVKKVGELNYPICNKYLDDILLIDEGHVCSKIIEMYNENGYIIEPAGVLSLCALDLMKDDIKNKTIVCIISGGNSDVFRMPEILERSLIYEGKKHYFKIEFAQKAGALRDFIMNIVGENDDIIYFRYTKLINKETGPVIIGIETKTKDDSFILISKMKESNIIFEKLTNISDI
jgi:threonine dehydratase